MIDVITQLQIADFDAWRTGYEAPASDAQRKAHGMLHAKVYQSAENPKQLTILSRWQSAEHMQGFLGDPEVQATMQRSGLTAPPSFQVLRQVVENSYA